ncbi:recombinase family protein [Arthrobacter sp. NPDC056493]|uniref:recombinase family protein n=1 Tax=Arthrobacter sp. NPDC056493 TaxID=3345839 RepID=UPI00366ED2AA
MSKRAAIYIRQSQTSDGTISPELQEKNVRSFIAMQGWEAGEVYSDIDISGLTEAKRPAFLKLKKDYAAGKFDIAVADDFSRFSRNKADAMALLGSMNIATHKEGVADTDDDFMPAMYFLLADKFSKDMSKRWRNALMHRLAKGLPPSGKNQFGYDKQGKEKYVPNADAESVKEAYARYTKGEGARTICEDFNARGLASAGPAGWHAAGFFDLLDKSFYAGFINYEGQDFPGSHEPLLTPAQWANYKAKRQDRKTHARPRNPKWMLSGLVVCGRCGGKMVSHMARGVPTLQCSTYNAQGKAGCEGIFRKRAQVQVAVSWWLGSHLEEWASAMPTNDEARLAAEKDVADAEAAKDAAQGRIDSLISRAVRFDLPDTDIAGPLAEFRAELAEAKAEAERTLAVLGEFTPVTSIDEQITTGALLMGFEEDPEAEPSDAAIAQYREALSKIIEKVIVHPATGTSPRDPERDHRAEVEIVPVRL